MNNWSTPHAHNSHGQPGAGHRERGGRHRDLVSEAMAHTEHAFGGGGNLVSTPKHTGGIDREGAGELWQPPATDSFRSRGGDRKDEMGLDQQARLTQFPTPAARDYKSESGGAATVEHFNRPAGPTLPAMIEHSFLPAHPTETHGLESSESAQSSRQRSPKKKMLNPKFVAWMMGLPEGWISADKINSEDLATWSYRSREHLRCLFSSIKR